jgi:thiosulfate dehydrogenase
MKSNFILILLSVMILVMAADMLRDSKHQPPMLTDTRAADCWTGAGANQIPVDSSGDLIRYGRHLIENTAYYLGPKGTVMQISNGMNCQNCHLEAGTKPWGNNFGAVASTYPKFRERSGSIESIEKRVNDCFERSLNGNALDTASKEMTAIVSYIKWLGSDIRKGVKPMSIELISIPLSGVPIVIIMVRDYIVYPDSRVI